MKSRRTTQTISLLLIVTITVVIGYVVKQSFAATGLAIEAESGVLFGAATKITDRNASGGAAVRFGLFPSPFGTSTSGYGFSAGNLPYLSASEEGKQLDGMKAMGATWIRVDLVWAQIQPTNGSLYNWSAFDRTVSAIRARGLQFLPILTYAPSWAAAPGCNTDRCAPADPQQYAAFAAAAVAHYAPQGVKVWEIWNEPNSSATWAPAASAEAYTNVLKVAYPAIKRVDPTATVIAGSLSPGFTGGGVISPQDFIKQLYAAGGRSFFDALSFHPYSYPAMPSVTADWSGWTQMLALRDLMTAAGDGAKKIWLTEYGAPTDGPGAVATTGNPNYSNHPDHVDEALQAQIATDAVRLYKSYPWAGPLIWYGYEDLGTDRSTNENFFGLLRADGSQKPSYSAFVQAISGR